MCLVCTNNLRQVEGIIADGVEDQVLQLVDDAEQVLSESRHLYSWSLQDLKGSRLRWAQMSWWYRREWAAQLVALLRAAPIRVVVAAAERLRQGGEGVAGGERGAGGETGE